MLDIPSTARSPQQMFGSIAKSYWAEKMGIPREKLVVVSIMPCLAKKYECDRDEFKVNGVPDVDYSISTRELARLIKRANIGFTLVLDSPFDNPMGESTGAGVIFGTTGGVMEAALRSVYEIYTGQPLKNVNFEQVRGLSGVRRATIDLNGFELKVGIAHGLGNARHLLEDIRNGHNEYHVIEIMACPAAASEVAGNRCITATRTFSTPVPTPFTGKMPTNLCANLTTTRIFRNCMKNTSANRWVRNRKCSCTRIISTNRLINFKQVLLCQISN